MPSSLALTTVEQALHAAAVRATLAPSVHNTQPWRFVVHPDRLDVYAEPSRRVPVVDPTGRQLVLSCGAAIFGARVALAGAQLDAVTTVLPDPAQANLLASITVVGALDYPDEGAVRMDAAADFRHSNRRRFAADPVPEVVLERLGSAAEVEGAWLHQLRDLDDRMSVATLSQRAEALQLADPSYLEELRAWTSDDPARRDGVPAGSVPLTLSPSHDDIPIRDFDTHRNGGLPAETRSTLHQSMVVLCTAGDTTRDWLRAGQALGRVLLELTSAGFVAGIMSQVVEEPATRDILRHELRLHGHPQLLIRIGIAEPTLPTPRLTPATVITMDAH